MPKVKLKENMLVILKQTDHQKMLEYIDSYGLLNIKIMTIDEFRRKYYFDYDERALYYLIDKYHYQYDVAKMYLSHIYEVEEEDFNSAKIRKIIEIKEELKKENLLYFNESFHTYLQGKTILLYNLKYLDQFELKMLEKLKQETSVETYQEPLQNYEHDCIWSFDTIDDEVCFVASKICDLIQKGIEVNKIQLCGVNSSYLPIIKRVFDWYHLPISLEDNYLFSTKIGQDFLKNLEEGPEESIQYLEEHYSLNSPHMLKIYNQIIGILNRYVWCSSNEILKIFIQEAFKKEKIEETHMVNEISIINSLNEAKEENYVFLLGFNQGDIPKTYRDESYFNDDLKMKLGLDTTKELNKKTYSKWKEEISNTKNLTITTKNNSPLGVHYLSSLNDDLKLEVKEGKIDFINSDLYNQLKLAEKLDNFIKYNEEETDLTKLYTHYPMIKYRTYDSTFSSVNPKKIKEYINNHLTLSYSAMNTYYQCGFRYYLSNILKLNIYEETFYTIIGNAFHYVLSLYFKKEIDIKKEYQNYFQNCTYPFNAREKFFIEYLEKELEFIIQTIQKQSTTNQLKKCMTEEKIEIDKSHDDMNVLFKGFVDKILLNEEENIAAIIDYKTGTPVLNLNHTIYGLDLQLPVYLYLVDKKYPNAKIAGFYLQKILNTEINRDNKHSYEYLKEEKLKLQGYSNSNIEILQQFDSNYYDSKVIKGMRSTSKGIASKKILNDDQINSLVELTEQKIEEAIRNIEKGCFDINPKRIGLENVGCKYCTYKDICFMNEKNILNLKEYKNMEFLGGEENDTKETNECNLDR